MAPRMNGRFVKALVYAALTAGFFVFVAAYYGGVHKIDQIDVSYFRAQRLIFIIGAVLLGIGISLRKHQKADAWFLSLLGGALLAAFLILFLSFGGITGAFDETGYAAANAQMVVIDGAAIACFVRCAVLCGGLRDARTSQKWTARLTCVALAVVMMCLIITGTGTRFARYDEEVYGYSEY